MVGGNPLHEQVNFIQHIWNSFWHLLRSRFGFRYWKDPGPWVGTDDSSRLMSFVNAINVAGFCMGGPEYISSQSSIPIR